MFQRWKQILKNWINCYFSKSTEHKQSLNIESLVTIISQLRENLNLDESKSSILEAHTVEEFLCEKYPEFKFDNGKVEASNQEEICLSASLLLYFVCVNSKNFDIKHAMCSKLSAEDQEIILKFSKSLMESSVITVGAVQAAITEACGQDIAAMELPRITVDETPPALRSLHSTVRRLQAALDAEKFDRNYLQDELIRTNKRLERLLKEKEQHKLEILNLKAKISLCCGNEEVAKNAEAAADVSAKLTRQLHQLEVQLDEMQVRLEEVEYERDVYKAKVFELRTDRDKWLTLSQQENATVTKLSEELEMERRQNQSLKDLVAELQQHHKLNGMDCSVECDDLDASIRSLQHNSTINSEACANVVEVQLGEERAKIVVLQHQIETLQEQISELNRIREADKTTLKNVIAQKETDICNLKHRINEEIEKKNNLEAYIGNEKTKLNNEINELEQRLKENHEYLNTIIQKKMEEIQILHEEKLSLSQSLNNETSKLENIIKNLKSELDTEKQNRSRMKEGYENHIMKLNDKVLNRNNELVELQNSIFEKGEMIETLQIELRNKKEAYSKLITQHESLNEETNIMQTEFEKEKEAFKNLLHQHQILNEERDTLKVDVEKIKEALVELKAEYQKLNDKKDAIEKQHQKVTNEKDIIEKQRTKEQMAFKDLTDQYNEMNEQYNIAQTDLKKVKEAGKKLQNKYHTLHEHHKELKAELVIDKEMCDDLTNKYEKLNEENVTLQNVIVSIKEAFKDISYKYEEVKQQKNVIQNELEKAQEMVHEFGDKCLHLEQENNSIQTGLLNVNLAFKQLKNEYKDIVKQNSTIQIELKKDNDALKELLDKCKELEEENNMIKNALQNEKEALNVLTNKYQECVKQNNIMELELKKQKDTFEELLHEYRNLDEHRNRIENDLRLKFEEEQNLKLDLENKVHSFKEKLTESENLADKLKKNYEYQIEHLNARVTKLSNYLKDKTVELEALRKDRDALQQTVGDSFKAIESLQEELKTEKQNIEKLTSEFESERHVLKNMVTVTESVMEDTKLSLADEISELLKAKDSLEHEKIELQALFKDIDMKYQALEVANASLVSLLRIGQKEKENVEMESELVRDYLDQVIRNLIEDKATNSMLVQNLESQNQTLTENNDRLKEDVHILQVSINALEQELATRNTKLENLYEEKSQLEETLKGNLATVQMIVRELEGKIIDITEQNNKLKLKEREDLAKIEDLKVAISIQEENLNIALQEKSQSDFESQCFSNKLIDVLEEKTQLENNIQDTIQNLNAAQLEINDLKNKIVLLTDENNNLRLEETERVANLNKLQGAMSSLEEEFMNQLEIISLEKAQLENNIQDKTQNLNNVQLKIDDLKSEVVLLTNENNNLKLEGTKSVAKLNELQGAMSSLEDELRNQLEIISLEKAQLEKELQALTEQSKVTLEEKTKVENTLEKQMLERVQLEKEMQTLRDQSKVTLEEKAIIENTLQEKNLEKAQLEKEIQALTDQSKVTLEDKAKIENILQEQMLETTHLQKEFQAVKDQFNLTLEEKVKIENILQGQMLKNTQLNKELQALKDQSKITLEEIAKIENILQEQKLEKIQLQKELHTLADQSKVTLEEKTKIENIIQEQMLEKTQLQKELQALKDQSLVTFEEKAKIEKNLQEQMLEKTQLQNEMQAHADRSKATLEEKTKIDNILQEQMQEITAVQIEKEDLESKIALLVDENNNLKLENGAIVKKLEESSIRESEFEKNLETCQYLINNYKVALKAVENELVTRKDQASKNLEEIRQDLVTLQQEFEKSKTEISDLTDEINNLRQEKEGISSELEEFKAKVEDLKSVQKQNEELKLTIIDLKNDIQAKEDSLKTLMQENSQLEKDLQSHTVQLSDALKKQCQKEETLEETTQNLAGVQREIEELKTEVSALFSEKNNLELEKKEWSAIIEELETKIENLEAVQDFNHELKDNVSALENEIQTQTDKLRAIIKEKTEIEDLLQTQKVQLAKLSDEKIQLEITLEEKVTQGKTHSDMITKLTDYLKEKTAELETLRKDKDMLQQTVVDSCKVIKSSEENLKAEKQIIDKLTSDFESERQMLKNMVSATESIMEDIKLGHNNEISQHLMAKDCLGIEKQELQVLLKDLEMKCQAVEMANASLLSLLKLERNSKQDVEKESENVRDYLDEVIGYLSKERNTNISVISALEFQEKVLVGDYEKMKNDLEVVQITNQELKVAMKSLEDELQIREDNLQKVLEEKHHLENELQIQTDQLSKISQSKLQQENILDEKMQNLIAVELEIKELKNNITDLLTEKNNMELEKMESNAKIEEFKTIIDSGQLKQKEELTKLKSENLQLMTTIEENRTVITNLEQLVKHELEENHKIRDENQQEKLDMGNRISLLQEYQTKAENVLEERQKEIVILQKELQTLQSKVDLSEQDSKAKDGLISKMSKEKDAVISTISKELLEEKALREKLEKELQTQKTIASELRNNIEIRALKKENEQLIRAIGQQETFTALSQEKATEKLWPGCHQEPRVSHQVDSSSSDTHSSVESLKTITDLEKIIHDKNRTITTLQIDITYMKSLMAESETKLLDVTKELEISKCTAQQLSDQLKKIVNQKNEEIADLKKQVMKMSATENRATQIIKVSAKYQAMILKRVAEIKSNTVLKELTNFGNTDNEVRRSLAGSITMEDLENFLETTDRHLKKCTEKQIALQKERDRLTEVNRIHESEVINLKKFLTELSVSCQTFNSVKELYGHKLSRVISVQRTIRREILNLDGRISDATMCKLERGYGAAMQDLAECAMNLERWVERCISRTVSVEKIKQAFISETDRSSLSSPSFQNTGLEVQLEELEKSFQKLLEEIARAVKSEGAKETQATTVMEVRAEYEDKLNRMKAKMKDLFNEQMAILKNKQREEIELLERELQKTRSRMEDSKRAYENHIKELTKELWSVGEKYLVKNDEAEWLKRKQRSGSLMSLQHVHSSGLVPLPESQSRTSDAHSLRSLPISDSQHKNKLESRGLHMSDEEGEVFDNRCLKELATTPRREPPGLRLSELRWRNSLCPPHLKSSYPAETQFATTLDEDDLKAGASAAGARGPRKEVGITAYKKPGPPTPSKQAGRLSATDSELRESVRADSGPHHAERKASTPARFRAFLRLNKNHDTHEGTPRARRLSSIFRKK